MATIIDVAKMAGVSKSTVSRYINGMHIKEDNRIRIESAIKELDYSINTMARGLKTKRSYTIGVVIPDLADLFITNIIKTCEDYFNKRGYSILLCDSGEDPKRERRRLEFLREKQVDGIILETCDTEGTAINDVINRDTPIVMIDRMLDDVECDYILTDNVEGIYHGVIEFLKKGHRRIGMVAGPDKIFTARERIKGYKKALADFDILFNPELVIDGGYVKEGGRKAFKALLQLDEKPTAVMVSNYFMGIGVIEAIYELDCKIPQDVSLIIFDNMDANTAVDLSRILKPQISTIRQPMESIGKRAAEQLLKRIENNDNEYEIIKLDTHLNLTESVGKI